MTNGAISIPLSACVIFRFIDYFEFFRTGAMLLRLQVVLYDLSFIPLVDLVSFTHTCLYIQYGTFLQLPTFSDFFS